MSVLRERRLHLSGPDSVELNTLRNRVAVRIANAALNHLASRQYRALVGDALTRGMTSILLKETPKPAWLDLLDNPSPTKGAA